MENFIRVTAIEYNIQGEKVNPDRITLILNQDLIGAFLDNEILLKGTDTLLVGGRTFKNILLAQRVASIL